METMGESAYIFPIGLKFPPPFDDEAKGIFALAPLCETKQGGQKIVPAKEVRPAL